jgi:uncharacterized protein (DUF2236 family)
MIWKINREHVVLLGGAAAAILQIAHPKVARGVIEHSDFRRDALGRLQRTLDAVYTIAFGNGAEVEEMAAMIARRHKRVQGTSGTESYSAFDADLQLWVLATLVVTAGDLYEQFVGPLLPQERQQYLEEMRIWGEFFGLPKDYGPQNWPKFLDYYRVMMNGEVLGSDPASADVARAILRPSQPFWLALAMRPVDSLATEIIPSPLREKLGLHSTRRTRCCWRVLRALFPTLYRCLPPRFRYAKEYRRAARRRLNGC